jgi:hypothetical protein
MAKDIPVEVFRDTCPPWLRDIAMLVDEWVVDPWTMDRFRRMRSRWAAEHRAPGQLPPVDRQGWISEYNPVGFEFAHRMTMPAKYAALAEIHDVICYAADSIAPREDSNGDVSKMASAITFCALRDRVTQLEDRHRPIIERILSDVKEGIDNAAQGEQVSDSGRPPISSRIGSFDDCSHSPDFTSVKWFGEQFQFAKGQQAGSVGVLWEAWEEGEHTLSQETIGKRVGSAATRFELRKVFRGKKGAGMHPAWGTMITPASKGVYGLSPPESAKNLPIRE